MEVNSRDRKFRTLVLLAVGLATGACAGQVKTIPPITPSPTQRHQEGRFVWYDLLTHDLPAVQRFYGRLFGWSFVGNLGENESYTLIRHHDVGIGGIVEVDELEGGVSRARWIPSLSVADVDRAVEMTKEQGGTVYFDPEDVPDRGRLAVVADPQGAVVAFLRASGGDPPETEPRINGWLWTELWTHDVSAAATFYRALVGYEEEVVNIAVLKDYSVWTRGGEPRAGVRRLPWEEVQPNWLPYVRVDDPAVVAARVEGLGGRVLLAPSEQMRQGSVALIADPSGAVLALQKWPVEEERNER